MGRKLADRTALTEQGPASLSSTAIRRPMSYLPSRKQEDLSSATEIVQLSFDLLRDCNQLCGISIC